MSDWIEQQVKRLNNPGEPCGKRLYNLTEEIANQTDVVDSFQKNAKRDVAGENFAKHYLAELEKVRNLLLEKAPELKTDRENTLVYWNVHTCIDRERAAYVPVPLDLAALYREFRGKYFGNKVPELSDQFVCCFAKLPFDAAGICYLEKDAARIGVRPGIRINEKFVEFPAEAKVALLHEMAHATGVRKHDGDFQRAIIELFRQGAYIDPLIL
jgi:hypothetical protein